jgi:hypothetical protein
MTKRGVAVGFLAAGLLVLGGHVAASANVVWCTFDPPVHVVTAGGSHLTVNNMITISMADKDLAKLVTEDATAAPDGTGGTLITVHVSIPQGAHGANVVSTNHRYKVTASASTPGGGAVLTLELDVPAS